jgi:rhamnose transport system substrate-binding protein
VKHFARTIFGSAVILVTLILAACGGSSGGTSTAKLDIAFLPKAINNPYFDAAAAGAQKAAGELKGTFKQVGPSQANAADQVPFIQTLTQQQVSAIVVSANDPNALAPALKQAQSKGIKVVTYDSDVTHDARSIFVNQASTEDIGRTEVQVLGAQLNYTGDIAILSATSTATNQNAWIDFMKQELSLPKYANMKLVKIAYGNDDDQTSYNQTQALVQAYPSLKGIISPTTVGIAAAARYLEANNLSGKIALTGLGTPNGLRKFVKDGTIKQFALWDVGHLGYLAYYAAAALVDGKITGKQGDTFTAGSLGSYTVGANGEVLLGKPTVFDSTNIDQFNF